jgi:hypothetical protein
MRKVWIAIRRWAYGCSQNFVGSLAAAIIAAGIASAIAPKIPELQLEPRLQTSTVMFEIWP